MPEHEVRAHIDECIEEASLRAVEGKPGEKIIGGLLVHTVFAALHSLAEERVAELHRADWSTAFDYSGTGSSYKRANYFTIYGENAETMIRATLNPLGKS